MEREPFYGTDDPPFYGEFSIGEGDVALKQGAFLPDEEYARLLDNAAIPCTDIVVLDEHANVLLARRACEPAVGLLWNQGGRNVRGRHPRVNAQLVLKRELGIMLPLTRFHYFGAGSFLCARRAQQPQENGSHTVDLFFYVVLTEEERVHIRPNEEYDADSVRWTSLADVENEEDGGWRYHPSIVAYAEFFLGRYLKNAIRHI